MEKIIREVEMKHSTFRDGVNFERFSMGIKSVIISKKIVAEIEDEMEIPMQEWIDEVQPKSTNILVDEINNFIKSEAVI